VSIPKTVFLEVLFSDIAIAIFSTTYIFFIVLLIYQIKQMDNSEMLVGRVMPLLMNLNQLS
jgi:hypothetical protein